MTAAARKRGVALTSRSRPLRPEDWRRFRHVVCMDEDNVRAVEAAVRHWESSGLLLVAGGCDGARVSLMTDWAPEGSAARKLGRVPDPYYGGAQGFEQVLDLLDVAAEGLLDAVLLEEEEEEQRAGAL
jgi:protein-tyrosine phosphatase